MGRITYNVAMSLDGFIAPLDGSSSWIVEDPTIDFAALYSRFSKLIMGRRTYESISSAGEYNFIKERPKNSVFVVSQTLDAEEHPDVTVVRDGYLELIRQWRAQYDVQVWVMGGGWLAGECIDAALLDSVEVAIMPVVLRSGYKLFGEAAGSGRLILRRVRELKETGILMTTYGIRI